MPWGVVSVQGADAVDFLQRLCSQDVAAMTPGQGRPAAFLNPKGKLIATCQALRTEKGFFLEVESTLRPRLAQLLEQYHFAEKLEIQVLQDQECGAWMGGPEVFDLAGIEPGTCQPITGGIAYAAQRHGMCWIAYHADAGFFASPPWEGKGSKTWSEDQVEAFRICARLLRMGVDADEDTLAMEAALDDHISLEKGCYTGQEIVARIHTYGHVNRQLCLLAAETAADIPVGAELVDEDSGQPVGRVTSSAPLPDEGRVALGYIAAAYASVGTTVCLREHRGGRITVVGLGR